MLYFFFPFYRGLTGVGGTLYSPFLDNHLNLVRGITRFLTFSARSLLEMLGYDVFQKDYRSLRIDYSRGIVVNPSCLGWAVMSFWVAFVFANNGTWKHRTKWIIVGISSICIVNVTRIALIALANHLHWKTITSLTHENLHDSFNIFSYGCIFILMFIYVRVQKKYEGVDFKREQESHTLSPI